MKIYARTHSTSGIQFAIDIYSKSIHTLTRVEQKPPRYIPSKNLTPFLMIYGIFLNGFEHHFQSKKMYAKKSDELNDFFCCTICALANAPSLLYMWEKFNRKSSIHYVIILLRLFFFRVCLLVVAAFI